MLVAQNDKCALSWMAMVLKTVGAAFVYLSSRLALCTFTFLQVKPRSTAYNSSQNTYKIVHVKNTLGLQVHSCSLLLELPQITSAVNNLSIFHTSASVSDAFEIKSSHHPTTATMTLSSVRPLLTRIAMPRVARHSPSPTHHRSPRKQQTPNTHLRYHPAHYGP